MFKTIFQKENGDTIIEVLISLAILTLVLGGAYYTANQSFRNDRDSQEHSEALTIAQSQLEELRTYLDIPNNSVNLAVDHCMDSSFQPSASCQVGGSNMPCSNSGDPFCYNVGVTSPQSVVLGSSVINTYNINVSWSALGGGTNAVNLFYRVE